MPYKVKFSYQADGKAHTKTVHVDDPDITDKHHAFVTVSLTHAGQYDGFEIQEIVEE